MSYTTHLYGSDGKQIGRMHHNSDWSGAVTIYDEGGRTVSLPGDIVQAIRQTALDDAREHVHDLCGALGIRVLP